MKKNIFLIFLIINTCWSIGCSDEESYATNSGLTQLQGGKSFSLLTMNGGMAEKGFDFSPEKTGAFIMEYSPDVLFLQDMVYDRTSNPVTDLAWYSSMNGEPRQGVFSPISHTGESEKGVGMFVKNTFSVTNRLVLNEVLPLHTVAYTLTTGDEITVATCQIEKSDAGLMQKQIDALIAYGDTVKAYVIVAASIEADPESDTMQSVFKSWRQSCAFAEEYTYPASSPQHRYDYVLTPESQPWGTKYVEIVGDQSTGAHRGIYIRAGLTN